MKTKKPKSTSLYRRSRAKKKSLLGFRPHHLSVILILAFFLGFAVIALDNQQSSSAATQRFPGDPNPKVSGKAFFGASGDHIASYEATTGKPMSLYRTFVSDWSSRNKVVTDAQSATNAGRLPWISVKTPGWGTLASGSRDSELDSLLSSLDAIGKPVWFTVHHEMENDTQSSGEYTAANYRAMQSHIRSRMNAIGTDNIAFAPIYGGYTFGSGSGRNPNDWYVAGIWDFIGVDHYAPSASQNPLRQRWYDTVSWIESKGLPYAVGEWGNRDYDNASQSASEMQAFWDWGWSQNNDAVGYSYFDSGANSPDGTWELWGARLTTFLSILNSNKVMRLSDLGSTASPPPPPSDTTSPTVNLTSPSNGTTVSGNITISGTASDNVGVSKVSLYIDGSLVSNDTSSPYSFSINTSNYADGSHSIQLRATDDASNTGQSSVITITVANSTSSGGSSNGGTAGQSSGSSKNTSTVISTSNLPSTSVPIPVSGDLVIQASSADSSLQLQIDGKPVSGNAIDTTKLTDGTHTVTVMEDGNIKHLAIEVDNPWYIAALNEFRASPVKFTAVSTVGTFVLGAGIWMMRYQIFKLLHHLKTRNYIHFGS